MQRSANYTQTPSENLPALVGVWELQLLTLVPIRVPITATKAKLLQKGWLFLYLVSVFLDPYLCLQKDSVLRREVFLQKTPCAPLFTPPQPPTQGTVNLNGCPEKIKTSFSVDFLIFTNIVSLKV